MPPACARSAVRAPRRAPRGRRGRSSPTPRPVPDDALRRVPAAVDLRPDVRRIWIAAGFLRLWLSVGHVGLVRGVGQDADLQFQRVAWRTNAPATPALQRRPAAPDARLPGGRLGRRGIPLRRLARRGRPVVVAGAAARAARRDRLAVRAPLRLRRLAPACSPTRTPHVSAGRARGASSRASASGSADWAAFAGGALADQVRFEREWSALRRTPRERGVRIFGDVPIYVAPGSADHAAHPELFQRRRRRRRPAGRLERRRPALGQPALRLARDARDRVTAGGSSASGARSSSSTSPRIDHFRGFVAYWAVPRAAKTAPRGRWRRGPGRELFDAVARASSASCRSSPRTSA